MASQKPQEKAQQLRVPPEAVMTVYLDEIASRLADIYTQLKETTPEGIDEIIFDGTLSTGTTGYDVQNDKPYHKLFKVEVVNKGPSVIYAKVNNEREFTVDSNEFMVFEKPKALISLITVRAPASTTIKLLGHY